MPVALTEDVRSKDKINEEPFEKEELVWLQSSVVPKSEAVPTMDRTIWHNKETHVVNCILNKRSNSCCALR